MKFSFDFDATPTAILTDGRVEVPFSDLTDLLGAVESHLQHLDVSPSTPLIFECANTLEHAIALLSLFQGGYSFLLLPPASPDFDPATLPRFFSQILRVNSQSNSPLTAETLVESLDLGANPAFQHIPPDLAVPERLFMRTSGSTGTPKLVVHHHDRVLANVVSCQERLQITPSDRVAIPVPLFHMYGLGAAFLPSMLAGASVDLQKGANLLRYIQREQAFNPNVAFLTPIFCEMLLKGRRSPRPYRLTVAAGDRVRSESFERYEAQFGCLVKLYGATEMGAMVAASPTDDFALRSNHVGFPLRGIELKLQQPQADIPPDLEDVGELWCANPNGFAGYVDGEGTPIPLSETDFQSGWFRTKDLGGVGSQGEIAVIGRCDHSVNRDGLLVFFADIERAIDTLETVDTAVVVAKGEQTRGKGLVAYCIPARGCSPSESDIRAHCFEHLPKRAIPDRIVILKTLPLLPNGKVDRQALVRHSDPIGVSSA